MNGFGNNCSCLWIILLLICCGGCGNGCGSATPYNSCGNNCIWPLLILWLCCGGCGCGCGNSYGNNDGFNYNCK